MERKSAWIQHTFRGFGPQVNLQGNMLEWRHITDSEINNSINATTIQTGILYSLLWHIYVWQHKERRKKQITEGERTNAPHTEYRQKANEWTNKQTNEKSIYVCMYKYNKFLKIIFTVVALDKHCSCANGNTSNHHVKSKTNKFLTDKNLRSSPWKEINKRKHETKDLVAEPVP